MDALNIIRHFYPEDTPLRRLLLKHSMQVRDKAFMILRNADMDLNREIISTGAMLHDIGIFRCHAPSIFCGGTEHYLKHGIIGGALLKQYGQENMLDLSAYSRICERHTGTGITAREIRAQNLPLEERDYLPETPEEKLICLADKFYSKSGDLLEKPLEKVRSSAGKFGPGSLLRLEELFRFFKIN